MNAERIINVFGAIVGVAMATVVVTSPQTANIIRAATSGFSQSLRAAMGR